ncbi:MAG: ABC transporter permease subunit [Thermoplasmata archaeon]
MNACKRRAITALMKKEFMNNVRNKWIIVLTLVFAGFIVLISAYGGIEARGNTGVKGFEFTIWYAYSLAVFFISIVAIMLGYKTVVEESESKTIGMLLASPLERKDILLGKFAGLSMVLVFSIVVGLGIGGIIIAVTAGTEGYSSYLFFIFLTVLFALIFLSISTALSTLVKSRSQALVGGILIWIFFNIIYDLILLGILMASGWELPTDTFTIEYPGWYQVSQMFNPIGLYGLSINRLLDNAVLPGFMNIPILIGVFILWIAIPIMIANLMFQGKDL